MRTRSILHPLSVFACLVCAACSGSPGRPGPRSQVIPPSQIMDFNILYAQNCAGCHDRDGKGGAAISLSNPVFLAIADDAAIRRTAANGVSGTPMPAFAQSAGGMLTDKQIDAVVRGIRSWAKAAVIGGDMLPPYTAPAPGDPSHGAQVYATYCATCHGVAGRGGSKASSIVNGSYLALVSDQNLRTIVITGRPELGSPDWRNDVPGNAMSPQDISDVVAWLSSQRPRFPGQPYPSASAGLVRKEFHDSAN
jgi:cytochrome c oxidase cbb3-type subunit III